MSTASIIPNWIVLRVILTLQGSVSLSEGNSLSWPAVPLELDSNSLCRTVELQRGVYVVATCITKRALLEIEIVLLLNQELVERCVKKKY